MYLQEIRLHVQDMIIILGSIVKKTYMTITGETYMTI